MVKYVQSEQGLDFQSQQQRSKTGRKRKRKGYSADDENEETDHVKMVTKRNDDNAFSDQEETVGFPMPTERGAPRPSVEESDGFKMPTKRGTATSFSENKERRKQPQRRPMKPHLSWPNCLPLGKKRQSQSNHQSNPATNQSNPATNQSNPTSSQSNLPDKAQSNAQDQSKSQSKPPDTSSQWSTKSTWKPNHSNQSNLSGNNCQSNLPGRARSQRGQPKVSYKEARPYSRKERVAALKYAKAYYKEVEAQKSNWR